MKNTQKISFDPNNLLGNVQVYVVGGAVRDHLLGRQSSDKDWVVVGATVDDMLQAGFTPVGSDFPVFLHPVTHEEYALARTERKSGQGYKGFTFFANSEVTLEEDLARRDFTINAMAMDLGGKIIDPYNGLSDLKARVFRHVSPAFVEDPLRVLRLARFLARFDDFEVASDTLDLCLNLCQAGEMKYLVAERVFTELNRGMGETKPSRMLQLLTALNVWPELVKNSTLPFKKISDNEFALLDSLNVGLNTHTVASQNITQARWAYVLGCFCTVDEIKRLADCWRMPKALEDSIRVTAHLHQLIQTTPPDSTAKHALDIESLTEFFSAVDVYRKPERLLQAADLICAIGGHSLVLDIVRKATLQQLNGEFKKTLRTRMSNSNAANSAQVAAAFKVQWIQSLLL